MLSQTSSHSSSLQELKAPEQRDMFRPCKVSSDVPVLVGCMGEG